MRILWVKVGGLWPPTAGGRIRSLEIISGLARRHDVTVLTTHGPDDDLDGLVRRLPHCHVESVPFVAPRVGSNAFAKALARSWLSPLPVDLWKWRVPAIRDRVRALFAQGTVDLCVADFLVAMANVPDARVPLVLFEHNVEYKIWQRLAALEKRPLRRAVLEIEWRKMRLAERAAAIRADLTITVSKDDLQAIDLLAWRSRGESIPTGVDTSFFKPSWRPESPHHLVFTGSMDWYPNEDAVLYFGSEILPRIKAQVPDVTMTIVGRNPSPLLRERAREMGMTVTGTVDDIRPHVDEAAVYVVPLRAGGGTRLKIFEALAMAKAVVSTTVGAEGLALTHGRNVWLADRPDDFAEAVICLFDNPAKRHALGDAGRALVESRYSWDHVVNEFQRYCQSVVAEVGRVPVPQSDRPEYFPKSIHTTAR